MPLPPTFSSAPFLVSTLSSTCKLPSWQLGEQFDYLVKLVPVGGSGRGKAVVGSITGWESTLDACSGAR